MKWKKTTHFGYDEYTAQGRKGTWTVNPGPWKPHLWTVHLNPDPRTAKHILMDLKKMCATQAPPELILNDHCQICEFRQRCYDQALQEDNLSLLRGLSEKEIKGYRRKGILTVTQLAHTFRPRRTGGGGFFRSRNCSG